MAVHPRRSGMTLSTSLGLAAVAAAVLLTTTACSSSGKAMPPITMPTSSSARGFWSSQELTLWRLVSP